ncbi:hypothetical protein CC78DRAFT_611315 [Lojkania enalia]|uniref:Uncharacterized protein n=1 Tax=Lojkania enalia TaxID=147567 RepID=A0A9P4TRB0_9PLEO|nr:hypothetical protein CC78DRAFT_611315 [Didymosphaeria enalia]
MFLHAVLAIGLFVSTAICRPTGTSSALDTRFNIVPKDVLPDGHTSLGQLKPRATQPAQSFHLIGFDDTNQIFQVRQAISDAQWLGMIGLRHLQGIQTQGQLTPEFQTYFGNEFNTQNLDTIRNIVNNLATIGQNGMLGFVIRSPTPHPNRPRAIASVRGRTMTIYPPFFENQHALTGFRFQPGDQNNFDTIRYTGNRATTIAHEIMHYIDNDYGPDGDTHIRDMTWAIANDPASPTYNGNFPTSAQPTLYRPEEANALAQLSQEQAMRNAANYQWFLWVVYMGARLARTYLPSKPTIPKPNPNRMRMLRVPNSIPEVKAAWETPKPRARFVDVSVKH